jgi:protoporphyrinogen oxidase
VSELDAVVVGGGISGLATAHCLARSGLKVELWESASRVGGKIHTASQDGYCLDSAASMVMNLRNEVDAFIETSGLDTSKLPRAPGNKRYVLDASRLQEVPTGFGKLLRTPLLSTAGKLRLLGKRCGSCRSGFDDAEAARAGITLWQPGAGRVAAQVPVARQCGATAGIQLQRRHGKPDRRSGP